MSSAEPKWLNDEFAIEVVKLLRGFVTQYTANSELSKKKITPKVLPGLFSFENTDRRTYMIELLLHLQQESILDMDIRKGDITYIRLVESAIPNLRVWLKMPEKSEFSIAWHKALDSLPSNIAHLRNLLTDALFLDTYQPEKIMDSLGKLQNFLLVQPVDSCRISWRQLSAHFFFGDSKYLDVPVRRSFLIALFPRLEKCIIERPLQLSVFLKPDARAILFIENWDTFLALINSNNVTDYHLLYTAGFKASAKSVRHSEGVQFFYSGDFPSINAFELFWFNAGSDYFDVYFLGDLDYSGLEILNKLSLSFPSIKAWRQGYEPMLQALSEGYGHTADQTGKEKQKSPSNLSCEYARDYLLPVVDETGLMLDQEWFRDI